MGLTPALTRSSSHQQGMLPPWLDDHSHITRVSGSFLSMVSGSQSPGTLGDGLHLQDSLVANGANPNETHDTVASVVATALSESATTLSTSITSPAAVPYATAFNPQGPTAGLGTIPESGGTSPVSSSATTDILKFFAGQVGLAAPSAFPRGPTGGGTPSAPSPLHPNPSPLGSPNTAFPPGAAYMGAKHNVGGAPTGYNPPAAGSLSLDQIISGDYLARGSGLEQNSPNPRRPSVPPGFEAPQTSPPPQNPVVVGSPLAWTGNTQFGNLAWSASPLPTTAQISSTSSHFYQYPYPNQHSSPPQPVGSPMALGFPGPGSPSIAVQPGLGGGLPNPQYIYSASPPGPHFPAHISPPAMGFNPNAAAGNGAAYPSSGFFNPTAAHFRQESALVHSGAPPISTDQIGMGSSPPAISLSLGTPFVSSYPFAAATPNASTPFTAAVTTATQPPVTSPTSP
ncbi:hypothetical protein IWQ62_003011 [Dispira parvispora]|uniref:Uncharacterized protein n=1 Tax=Dispira parvispora TaxID=1520584 RepID=A0A9W8ARN9_9FUNG|nr:hypothetical protein IWQ62_003011 [Dispira parvispora]